MAVSYGTYTITNIQEGSQIWTTSVAPTTPNYTFTISNLTGDSETSIKVGDIIMYDFYRYTVSNVNSDGTTVLTGDRTSIRGATGASATTYHLILSTLAIVKGSTGSLSPSSIVLTAKSQSGSNAMANYSGRFKIETTTNNSTWSTKYTSSGNEATKTYILPTDIVAVRCSLYLAGGTTTLLDQQTVPVVTNGIEITSTSVTYQSGTSGTTKPIGTWQTTIPSVAQGNYLWTKTVVNYSDGTSTESYSVARQGNNGTNGEDGTSPTVTSTVTEYVQSTDGVNKPTSGWNTTPPTAIPEQYIWSRVTVTYSDNATAVSYSVSRNGTDGTSISISSTSVTYQKGTSGTTKPTGTWQTGIPSVGEGEYLWTKTVVTYSDSSKTESYSVSRNATNGTSPTVTSTVTEYVQSDSGTNKPSSGWNTTPPTAIANKYMWTKVTVTYSDGATAISYSVAKNGTNGNNGVNTATIYLYKRATSTPSVPSGNTTYTFSTKALTGTLDNWEQSIPTGTDTCYVIAATASSTSSTDTISSSEWSTPIQFNGTDGTNGYNQATIFLYHRGASATKPSTSVTYTFSSGALSSTPTGWSRTVPAVDTDKNPCWVTTAVAISKNSSVSIASSGWATPTKMVEDGIDGIDGKDGTDGKDAYTISLSNDNHTFAGDTTKAIQASVDCSVIGFKGATQVSVTIGTITGQPTGMTTSITGNNTTNAYFTVNVTASMTTRNGVLTIPVTIDGKSFTKKFTYSLALKGDKGDKGGTWYSGTGITGTSTTATIFSNSGISSAIVGDMYLNTTTYNTYRCTVAGNASTAKWVYVNNIKGGKGDVGNTGKGISSIKNQYYLSTSNTTQTGGSWVDTVPTYVSGRYYWTKSHIVWSDNTETDTQAVLDNALTSANSTAKQAKDIANNTAQYFWVSSDTTDAGVHITKIPQNDFVADRENGGGNLLASPDGIVIRDGLDELAVFGADGICIGKNEESNAVVDFHSFKLNDKEGSTYFNVGDLRDASGILNVTDTFEAGNNRLFYSLAYPAINNNYTVTVSDNSGGNITRFIAGFRFESVPTEGAIITAIYQTNNSQIVKAMTFGSRTSLNTYPVGGMSISGGTNNVASAKYSIAIGKDNVATGEYSFALGYGNTAKEDHTVAIGFLTTAKESWSQAQNCGTIAASHSQTAIGKYNIEDSYDTYGFIIGNGSSDDARSNAMTVDWNGNLNTAGTIRQNGTAVSLNGHNHSASNITSGTLSVERGGSGSSGVTSITTIEDVAASGSGYSVTQAQFCSWGKVATIHLAVKKNSSAGSGTQTICTLKSGCRPKFASPGNYGYASNCVIATDGAITISGSVAANALLQIYATYVLA